MVHIRIASGVDAAMKIALSYKMGDITLSAASDNEGAADSTNSVGVSYTMDAITVSYTAAGDKGADLGDDYDLKLSYSAGALTASFSTNEEDVTKMIATYDLGGATAFFSNKSEMVEITKQWVSTSHSNIRIRSVIEGRSIWVALFLLIETFVASP